MARRGKPKVSAAQVYVALERQLAQGWPAGLTTLTGDDLYYLDRAQHRLLQALVPDDEGTSFALTVFGEERVGLATVIQAARSVGMFSPLRVVLVRDVDVLDGEADPLVHYAAHPPAGSHLIVRAPVVDRRRKLHKALLEEGHTLQFVAPEGFDPTRWGADVTTLAREKGLRLDRQGTALLAQLCAGDLYRVSSELEKIQAWLGGGEATTVTAETVQQVASSGGIMSGWEVADAILVRDLPAALAAARRLVESGDEPIRIVGGLAYRARVMLQAKAMLAAGASLDHVTKATRSWNYRDTLRRGVEAYSLERLRAFPALLLSADRTLKSRNLDARSVLEDLVQQMAGP